MPRPKDEAALRTHISSVEMGSDISRMREGFGQRAAAQPALPMPERIGGVEVYRVGSGPRIVWFHGGGHVLGGPETHMVLATRLASYGVEVILPRTPRAPEHRWPAQRDSATALLDGLEDPVAIGGDSAGGHLALVAALARRSHVQCIALVSPNTDRTGMSRTRERTSDLMNDGETDAWLWQVTAPDLAANLPEASPHLGALRGLPPIHIEAVGDEVLLDDALILARAAAADGVSTSVHVTSGLFHMHTLWPDALPEGAAALQRIAAHVRRHG